MDDAQLSAIQRKMTKDHKSATNLAFTALLGLRKIGPFLGQRPALLRLARVAQAWMGIFKWSVYLFSGRIESADKSDPRRRASIDVLSACWCAVGQYDSIRETMVSTPATIEIATRCWLEEDDGPIPSHVDAPVGTCVLGNLLKHATSAQLDRVLKMTGGKADEIAKLAISHLRGALTMRPVNATRLVIYLDFINSLSRVGTHPLRYALLGANVICPFFDKLDPDDLEMVLGVLGDILPRYCVYRSVIQTMDEPMRKIDGGAQKERVMRSIAKDVWFKFFKLVRVRVLVLWEADTHKGKHIICDNVKECQAIAWKEGDHKNMCKMKQRERMEGKSNPIPKRDIALFHQLSMHHARTHLPRLRRRAVAEFSTVPRHRLVICIDYTVQPAVYSLRPLDTYNTGQTSGTANTEARNDALIEGVRENPERYALIESKIACGRSPQCVLTLATGAFWEWMAEQDSRSDSADVDDDSDFEDKMNDARDVLKAFVLNMEGHLPPEQSAIIVADLEAAHLKESDAEAYIRRIPTAENNECLTCLTRAKFNRNPRGFIAAARKGSETEIYFLAAHLSDILDYINPDDALDIFLLHIADDRIPTSLGDRHSRQADIALWSIMGLGSAVLCFSDKSPSLRRVIDAWPSILNWTEFFLRTRMSNIGNNNLYKRVALDQLGGCWHTLTSLPSILDTMRSSPTTLDVVMRCWIEDEETTSINGPLWSTTLAKLLGENVDPEHLDRIVKAARGRADLIATYVLSRLRIATSATPVNPRHITAFVHLIGSISCVQDSPLSDALLGGNAIWYVTKALLIISIMVNTKGTKACAEAMMMCFLYLSCSLEKTDGAAWVLQALEAGLLSAFVNCSQHFSKLSGDKEDIVDVKDVLSIIESIIPQYLVYRSIIEEADAAVTKINRGPQKERVMKSIAKDIWERFSALVEERATIVRQADAWTGLRIVCDYIKECQAIGWIGGHKNACERIRQERMEGKPNRLSKSDNMFLHQIATCYARNNLPVLHEMAETDYSSTPRSHLVIRIDFTTQPVRFTLCPLAEYEVEPTPESIVVETQNETILAGVKENMGSFCGWIQVHWKRESIYQKPVEHTVELAAPSATRMRFYAQSSTCVISDGICLTFMSEEP
ncbi:hypothetical protein POSPLADRAFT_1043193 [Postia placenta MAD-698-R-SB12]|uniref:Uncharacterized protein n=1 Tax=Postia placenta MAD-698-R-SB12 TaxID=670580 RepID=A0A1X6NI37_9APHY|nr:hypothetical protein POSPLADRAFT_1043193 [Postia placenta MAD-698-R-SB12]OSX68033.1 hypothetical protein POSPLADRAFT_1043193 [Postia placenta MAD-698-R-SB12]